MEDSSQLRILKGKKELLLAKRNELLMQRADQYAPSESSAKRILEELGPLNEQIESLDEEILKLSPLSSLTKRLDQLQSATKGRDKDELLKDRNLGKAIFDQAEISREISRRKRLSPATRRKFIRFAVILVLVLLIALAKLSKGG